MRRASRIVLASGLVLLASCAAGGKAPAEEKRYCRLTPIHAGICTLGADHVLGDAYSADERLSFILLAFLVEGPAGEKALIDLGPMTLEYTNDMFRRYGFFRDLGPQAPPERRYPDDILQPRGNVFCQLETLGVAPRDVDHIVLTHLHADHHGMDDAVDGGAAERFTEAVLHASRIGWEQNLAKRKDGRWGSYVDYAFGDFLLERETAGKARFADGAEIFPGLRTMYLGGHSVCSQAVIVETSEGPAIIASDDIYLYSLLARNVLPRIHTSPAKHKAAVAKLVTLAEETGGILLPVHDPEIWRAYETHGDGWLGALRALSDAAIRGYESSRAEAMVRTVPELAGAMAKARAAALRTFPPFRGPATRRDVPPRSHRR